MERWKLQQKRKIQLSHFYNFYTFSFYTRNKEKILTTYIGIFIKKRNHVSHFITFENSSNEIEETTDRKRTIEQLQDVPHLANTPTEA